MKGLDEFLNEGKTIQVKRKYGTYDSIAVGNHAPIRSSILGFVNEKGCCTKDELLEFIKAKNEESGATTNISWVTKNAKYLVKNTNESGETTYKLSKLGKRVINATTISE
jgi:hypothetical protein